MLKRRISSASFRAYELSLCSSFKKSRLILENLEHGKYYDADIIDDTKFSGRRFAA